MDALIRKLAVPLTMVAFLPWIAGCPSRVPAYRPYTQPPFPPDSRRTSLVYAADTWQDTGVVLEAGNELFIDAKGSWSGGLGWDCGPSGAVGMNAGTVISEEPSPTALIARIGGGHPFSVRDQYFGTVGEGGRLYLRMNDPTTSDNSGAITVDIYARKGGGGRGQVSSEQFVTCDVRIIRVSDGSAVGEATARTRFDELDALAKALAEKLRDDFIVKGEPIAVISLRNRSGDDRGRSVAAEVADKLMGALIATKWFDVKERIDLRALVDEKDLDGAGIVRYPKVRGKLAGVRFVIIGGVTTSK